MKNLLILLFSLISFIGYSQTVLDPTLSPTAGRINAALQEAITLSGTDTYTATKAGVSYTSGYAYDFNFANGNATTSPTINLNPGSGALGAKSIRKYSAGSLVAVAANDLKGTMRLRYDGTFFVLDGIGNIGSGSGGGTWGSITGTLSSQTDLQSALDAKQTLDSDLTSIAGLSPSNDDIIQRKAGAWTNRTPAQIKTDLSLTKSDVGLSNVDNTSDASKPVSTLQAAADALNLKIASNLSDLNNAVTARTNLGLGALSTVTPGTGIAAALAVNVGSAGAPVLFNGAGGTPSSLVGTNITGTAAGLTAGTVTTNANLTGPITSVGNATSITNSSIDLTTKVTGTLPVSNGGTGVTASSGASSVVLRDANQNITVNNSTLGYTTTATAAGTTTLTVSSTRNQYWTGSLPQTVLMPVTSTLALGFTYYVVNNSSGVVTVQSSGANTIQAMAANSTMELKVISTSGTTGSSWSASYYPSNPMTTLGDLLYGLATGEPAKIGIGSNGDLLAVVSGIPAWVTGITGVTTNSNAAAGKVGEYTSSLIAVGSATSFTTATAKNVTSISLTAGDWDVYGNVSFTEGSATVTARTAGITSTSATLPTDGTEIENGVLTTLVSEKVTLTIPTKRVSLSATTTVYLIGSTTFSAGTSAGYGFIGARRVR